MSSKDTDQIAIWTLSGIVIIIFFIIISIIFNFSQTEVNPTTKEVQVETTDNTYLHWAIYFATQPK